MRLKPAGHFWFEAKKLFFDHHLQLFIKWIYDRNGSIGNLFVPRTHMGEVQVEGGLFVAGAVHNVIILLSVFRGGYAHFHFEQMSKLGR